MRRPKLLFLVTEDSYFWSHRVPVARAALRDGYEVVVATHVRDYGDRIRDEGFRVIPMRLSRETQSPFQEVRALLEVRKVYRTEQPDLCHQVALKPILYGSIALLGQKRLRVVNAFAGLGYLVASSSWKARLLRIPIWNAFKFLLNRPNVHLLFQNQEDQNFILTKVKASPERVSLIRGSGVDIQRFQPLPEPVGTPVVLLASRMLWMKGIEEFVEAAKLLRGKGIHARFVLAGDTDPKSLSCITRQELLDWQASGAVEWWGHQPDIEHTFKQANIVCLPSRGGEGVPKALLDAAACGRALVATDVPGCRDVVRHGISGLLVPPRNASALAQAIEQLLKNPGMRREMASRARTIVVGEFSDRVVMQQTLALYHRLLNSKKP